MRDDQPQIRAARVKAIAAEMGFDACGIAPSGAPEGADYFRRWIEAGRHGEMAWLAANADRRCDPALVLPGIRSVAVVAMNYYQSVPAAQVRVAKYALGRDYHSFMTKRIRKLSEVISHEMGCVTRSYVDTGPVLEREFAARAGIGWQSKSTMLVSQKWGTWLLLGAVYSSSELAPDRPAADRCGSCSRCIDACPTGAITAPYQLDARLCIAYLTIENRGPIPEAIRPAIGDRIFGCDECLEVCPWNRFARETRHAEFRARELPPARDLLALDEDQFVARFEGSPIRRVKRSGLFRNICVALGNSGGPEDVEALQRTALQGDAMVSEHARWAIDRIRERRG